MRQGWTFLDDPAGDESSLIHPALLEVQQNLMPGRFATLDAEGGGKLAGLLGFQRHPAR